MKVKVVGAVAVLLLAARLAGTARADDFTQTGSQQLTVNTFYQNGWLYNQSKASIVVGGGVNLLRAYNTSTAAMSGGYVAYLNTYDTSTVDISGGEVNTFYSHNTSTVNFTILDICKFHYNLF